MGVDQERVQSKLPAQVTKTFVEQTYIVAFVHHPGDVGGFDAGRDEEDAPFYARVQVRCHVVSGLLYRARAPQVVVEGVAQRFLVHPEEDVDTRRLDVGVHDADATPLGCQQRGDVGRRIRFAGPAPERVDGDDLRHVWPSFAYGASRLGAEAQPVRLTLQILEVVGLGDLRHLTSGPGFVDLDAQLLYLLLEALLASAHLARHLLKDPRQPPQLVPPGGDLRYCLGIELSGLHRCRCVGNTVHVANVRQ